MVRAFIIWLVFILLTSATAAATKPESSELFDRDGNPSADAQALVTTYGLPRLISGAPIRFPEREANLHVSGCVSVEFTIGLDGLTDKFVIVDAHPKGLFDQAVLESLKEWRFQPPSKPLRVSIPMTFSLAENGARSPGSGARENCVVPRVEIQSYSDELEGRVMHSELPYYPPGMVEQRTEGCATVSFSIGSDGLADEYELFDGDSGKGFFNAAIQALNKWRFTPEAPGASRKWVLFRFRIPGIKSLAPRQCRWPENSANDSSKTGVQP